MQICNTIIVFSSEKVFFGRQKKMMIGFTSSNRASSKKFWLGQGKLEWEREERENYPNFTSQ